MTSPGIEHLTIIGVPSGWTVIGLLGSEAHVPSAILPELRELLPPGSITRPPSIDGILPPLPTALMTLLDADDPPQPDTSPP